jgi:hypothetical protein
MSRYFNVFSSFGLILAIIGIGTTSSFSQSYITQPGTTPQDIEKEIIALAKRRSEAVVKTDTFTLGTILSSDFRYINIWGDELSRSEYLGNNSTLGSGDSHWISQDMDSINVRVLHSAAIITFRVHDQFKYEGIVYSNFCRSVFIYEQKGDKWKCIFGQTTKVD